MEVLVSAAGLALIMVWMIFTLRAAAAFQAASESAPPDEAVRAQAKRRVHALLVLGPALLLVVAGAAWLFGVKVS